MNFTPTKNSMLSPVGTPLPKPKFGVYDETWNVKQPPVSHEKQNLDKIAGLVQEINAKDQEIAELRLNNEVLVAAMYHTKMPLPNINEPDAVEISHRIVTRLAKLRKENERLMLAATGSHAAQLEVEVSHLKKVLAQYKRGTSSEGGWP